MLPDYKKLNDSQKLEFLSLVFKKCIAPDEWWFGLFLTLFKNQNHVYPQYSLTMIIRTQNIIRKRQWYSSFNHSTQDPYLSSPQALYPQYQSDNLLPSP